MTAVNGMADVRAPEAALAIPRLEDGFVNMREPLRQLAESVVNEMMSAEADRLCEATGSSRSGCRERGLVTRVGTLAPGIPRLRTGSLFPDDATGRYQGAAVSETCATGTSTRKARRVAAAMGMERLSKDQVSAMCEHLDSDVFCQAEVNGNITRN
jgi:putative transposase